LTSSVESVGTEQAQLSLSTAAARNLATTTKSVPQMQEITSRWLLRKLPWVEVSGGTYRVNRRLTYLVGDGRLTFTNVGSQVRVVPAELGELPLLRGFEDEAVLSALADRFEQQEYEPGQVIAEFGNEADHVYLIAHGKVSKLGNGEYGNAVQLGVLADGQFFGEDLVGQPDGIWDFTVKAMTGVTVLALPVPALRQIVDQSEALAAHIRRLRDGAGKRQNKHGEAEIEISAGHAGEQDLPGTFVDYEQAPREYELSVAQTVLRVHTRVADLYNDPMNQLEQQLRLTVEALRERQEYELVNNESFGLLPNSDLKQRIHTKGGPPTPDDLDELLGMRRSTRLFLAHPKAIVAFGRECTKRGIYPSTVDVDGRQLFAWRGVPIYPCSKIPVSDRHTTSILAMRTGEADQGVVGLHQTGLPDEYEPGLSVRFMGINEKAIMSYLVSAYYSAAILVPDALGVLENVELFRESE
jgi:CRP-like cAMP-binding protein